MKSKIQILRGAIQKQRLVEISLLIILLSIVFTVFALYRNNLSDTAKVTLNSSSTALGSTRNFAATSVTKTFTAKGTLIVNNLWRPTDQIAAGGYHTCALANGKVYCWGLNGSGQLGNGTTVNSSIPVVVGGLLSDKIVTQITAGESQTCALANGKVYCWGSNQWNKLGDGTSSSTNSTIPVAVKADTSNDVLYQKTVTQIAGEGHITCALANGKVYCWGYNGEGGLGNGTLSGYVTPVAVKADATSDALYQKTVTQITGGNSHMCALANGQAFCWGYNNHGGLGNNSTTRSTVPVAVKADATSDALYQKTVTQITAGRSHTCALANSKAFCWGYNASSGQLGIGNYVSTSVPVAVYTASGGLSDKTVTHIEGGGYHTCAIDHGKAYCWGHNVYGQLGNNSSSNTITTPVAVNTSGTLSGKTITQVTGGGENGHTCALTDGQAFCWGRNNYGQLGNSSTIDTRMPGVRVGMY